MKMYNDSGKSTSKGIEIKVTIQNGKLIDVVSNASINKSYSGSTGDSHRMYCSITLTDISIKYI